MNFMFRDLLMLWMLLSLVFWVRPLFFTHRWRVPLAWWLVLCVLYWAIPAAGWIATRHLTQKP